MWRGFVIFALLFPFFGKGQASPKKIIELVNQRFGKVQTYSGSIQMFFDIPGVQLDPIQGKVYYKKPNKFRIHSNGIIFLPKQNPYYTLQSIRDTNSYTAFLSGTEIINGKNTLVINVIPNGNAEDLILAKIWIEEGRQLIHKAQLTTKSSGTITIEQVFGNYAGYGLPDEILFSVDVSKFKIPKAVAMELNSKSKKENSSKSIKGNGKIRLKFSNYILNKGLEDKVFEEKK